MKDIAKLLQDSNPAVWKRFINGEIVFFPIRIDGVDAGIFRNDADLFLFRCPELTEQEAVQEISRRIVHELSNVRKKIDDAEVKRLYEGDEHKGLVVEH